MKSRSDLLRILKSDEGIARISALYGNRSGVAARQLERYMLLVKKHEDLFGNEAVPRIIRSQAFMLSPLLPQRIIRDTSVNAFTMRIPIHTASDS